MNDVSSICMTFFCSIPIVTGGNLNINEFPSDKNFTSLKRRYTKDSPDASYSGDSRKSWSIKTYSLFLCSVDNSHVFKRDVNYKHFYIITKHVTRFSVSSTDLPLVILAAVYAYVVKVIKKFNLRGFNFTTACPVLSNFTTPSECQIEDL
jgi:hypothetical protein